MRLFFSSEKLTVLFLVLLGFALSKTQGNYHLFWVTTVFAVFCLWSLKQLSTSEGAGNPSFDLSRVFDWIIFIFALNLGLSPRIIYHTNSTAWFVLLGALTLFVILSGVSVWRPNQQWVFMGSLVLLIILRILTLLASPNPRIDVFTNTSIATNALLQGLNPYTQTYPDIYAGLREYKIVPGILYPPFTLFWVSPFQKLFGDIRVAFLTADLGVAFSLRAITKKLGLDRNLQNKLVLVWLSLPVSLFILEQSWIDTLLIFEFSLAIYFLLNSQFILCGFLMGVMLATKQYSVIFVSFLGWRILKDTTRSNAIKVSVSCIITSLVLFLPFLLWNFGAFFHSVVEMPLQEPFRTDSFSVLALLKNEFDISVSAKVISVISMMGLALGLFHLHKNSVRQLPAALILTFGIIFFFGKQAFCNYYQIVCYLLLLSLVIKQPSAAKERL